ncbi:hypothetical protein FOZ61_007861 [Perkinsus olseni]|uniref:Uncharacterized protein n=1 Tax=Perkinsus olseni TaxID=32597 RepID=A0A7J6LGT7_PEROL|nr:hypothetical protein FOZ61_007861 [Perkinsus olseni]KAF4658081.1 hypothetical protein FOL46_007128 [Perkinsus olseni]
MASLKDHRGFFKRASAAIVGTRQLAKVQQEAVSDFQVAEERSSETYQHDGIFLSKMFTDCTPKEIERLNVACESYTHQRDHVVVEQNSSRASARRIHFIVQGSCRLLLATSKTRPRQEAYELGAAGALLDSHSIAELGAGEPFGMENYVLLPPSSRTTQALRSVYTVVVTSHECRLLSLPFSRFGSAVSTKILNRLHWIYAVREVTRTRLLPQVMPESRSHFLTESRRQYRRLSRPATRAGHEASQRMVRDDALRFLREARAESRTDFERYFVPIRPPSQCGQSGDYADLRHGILLQSAPMTVFRLWRPLHSRYPERSFVRVVGHAY